MIGRFYPVMACYGVSAVTGCVRRSNRMSRKIFALKSVALGSNDRVVIIPFLLSHR
ncbi:unnamed protein product [Penicillium salamii]|uniref:Uncharacterized protein n=1 Tax=Penicillium salamii TaxID=1612424 RepID=A0A9W4N5W7_9EURO|nr:unnamed protein product [Penicillium salamii]CAG7965527.1 unnamed protein product [Penicillium salamii]CAG7986722.1 unnamed protein product [Penicillium salamii]CAG8191627.1 unnamed protein product [Penicillium salamii]CAG8253280.1 unnamed protein product [Penicillium salamii]